MPRTPSQGEFQRSGLFPPAAAVVRRSSRCLVTFLLPAFVSFALPLTAQEPREQLQQHLRQAQVHLDKENYPGVVEELDQAIAIHAEIPGAYFQLGLAHFQLGRTQEAEEAFLRELKFEPPDAYSLYYLGRVHLGRGETEKAVSRFEQTLAIGEVEDVRLRLAGAHLKTGAVDKAVVLLEQGIEQRPERGELHYLLGRAYRAQRRMEDAKREFDLAESWKNKSQEEIRIIMEVRRLLREGKKFAALGTAGQLKNSGDENTLLSVGIALGQHNHHREALPILERVVAINPNYAEGYYNLGRARALLHDPTGAERDLKRAVELRPQLYEAQTLLGTTLVSLGKNEQAVEHLRAAAELRPGSSRLLSMLGLQYLQLRYYREAIKALSRAVELDSGNADLHFLLIQAHFRSHDYEKALEAAEQTLRRFPEQGRADLQVGTQLDNMGRYEEAEKHLRAALSKDRGLFEARILLGEVLLKMGRPEEGIAVFRQAMAKSPRDVYAYAGLGKALIQLKRYEETVEAMEKAVGLDSELASIHLYLSRAYRALGRAEEAKREAAIFTRLNRKRATDRDRNVEREYVPKAR